MSKPKVGDTVRSLVTQGSVIKGKCYEVIEVGTTVITVAGDGRGWHLWRNECTSVRPIGTIDPTTGKREVKPYVKPISRIRRLGQWINKLTKRIYMWKTKD